jgi:hypothetical protein
VKATQPINSLKEAIQTASFQRAKLQQETQARLTDPAAADTFLSKERTEAEDITATVLKAKAANEADELSSSSIIFRAEPAKTSIPDKVADAKVPFQEQLFVDLDSLLASALDTFQQEDLVIHQALAGQFASLGAPPAPDDDTFLDIAGSTQPTELSALAGSNNQDSLIMKAHEQNADTKQRERSQAEPITFTRFMEVMDSMGNTWTDQAALQVFRSAMQIRLDEPPGPDECAMAVRMFGRLPVQTDFSLFDFGSVKKVAVPRDRAERDKEALAKRLMEIGGQLLMTQALWQSKHAKVLSLAKQQHARMLSYAETAVSRERQKHSEELAEVALVVKIILLNNH